MLLTGGLILVKNLCLSKMMMTCVQGFNSECQSTVATNLKHRISYSNINSASYRMDSHPIEFRWSITHVAPCEITITGVNTWIDR